MLHNFRRFNASLGMGVGIALSVLDKTRHITSSKTRGQKKKSKGLG